MTRLSGRTCVVTGATGMAADAARRFAAEGAKVFVISRDLQECHALGLPYAVADLRDEDSARQAFAEAAVTLGRLDAVYAVAGGSGRRAGDGPVHEVPVSGWDSTLRLNATPAFLTARETVRLMRAQEPDRAGRGALVLMSSVLAFAPAPELFSTHAYAAAKAAIIGLGRTLAARYAPERIRVNVIAPGLVTTPMSRRAAADPDSRAFAARKQPLLPGFLDPSDVTAAALYLCSDDSRAVTGQVLTVDGGWTVTGTWSGGELDPQQPGATHPHHDPHHDQGAP